MMGLIIFSLTALAQEEDSTKKNAYEGDKIPDFIWAVGILAMFVLTVTIWCCGVNIPGCDAMWKHGPKCFCISCKRKYGKKKVVKTQAPRVSTEQIVGHI